MRAYLWKATLLSLAMTISSTVFANFISLESENFTLVHSDSNLVGFGAPEVEDNTINYLPENMGVSTLGGSEGKAYQYWSTSISIFPEEGINFTTLNFSEMGDFGSNNSENDFYVYARLFITDINDSDNWQYLSVKEQFLSSGDGTWDMSGSIDLNEYSDGFVITIQNILEICTHPGDGPLSAESLFLASGDDGGGKPDVNLDENFLRKTAINIELETAAVVPVPAALWFFSSALGILGLQRRIH